MRFERWKCGSRNVGQINSKIGFSQKAARCPDGESADIVSRATKDTFGMSETTRGRHTGSKTENNKSRRL